MDNADFLKMLTNIYFSTALSGFESGLVSCYLYLELRNLNLTAGSYLRCEIMIDVFNL